ncbi:MAG: GcrA family cell cycle regulator [Pseudomonadota bacterium]
MAWTDDRVEKLKKLWAEGLSASQIARELGEVTRNAVIGKVHRLGLSGRATRSRSDRPRPRPLPRPQPKPVLPLMESVKPATLDNGDHATLMTLSPSMCKWPIGDPGSPGFHFCGNKAEPGMPYCKAHARLAYQPANKRDKKRAAG